MVRIDNESRYPLHINGRVYRLYLNDIDVGKGMTSETLTVPRLGSANQEILFHLNNIRLISRIQSLLESKYQT
jgi:LEA14-like dessication related protein